MEKFEIKPSVDETQEFIEIANDFSNPLDIVREAVSNAFDARAKNIYISFDVVKRYGEKVLKIVMKDDGLGMDKEGLQSFFDLGNSLSRGKEENIGEKGHGTKVYFNSSKIEVITQKSGSPCYRAIMDEPIKKLFDRNIPIVDVSQSDDLEYSGTEIIIYGYNNNRRDKFTHENLKDYILWFTKFGSFELKHGISVHQDSKFFLKGFGKDKYEELKFGHVFPEKSPSVQKLFEKYMVSAPDYYCKQIIKEGHLKNHPEISYQATFSIEGNKVKQWGNPMLRRSGKPRKMGDYTVQERYGIWLCKDFIPIQRKNEWITKKGSEYVKFHAFFNCQDLRLTANRGSVDNTPSEILDDIRDEVRSIYNQIIESNDWTEMEWLESEATAYKTIEKEQKEFKWREKKILNSKICEYKNIVLVEPSRESGVFALVLQLSVLEKDIFPFKMLDYDTHSGLDVIAKGDSTTPVTSAKLYYVEFKFFLTKDFNHSFQNLYSIVCWDTTIKHDEIVKDLKGEERKMQIIAPESEGDYTKFFLDNPRSIHKIEVFVLKHFLKEKLGIDFRPRTSEDSL
ncbi:ATP-binding protein [uncultured Microscilla sp.]|uniref:ATP-binding protein n=1 Tax=uncultured Microscilla sp. TaxID=432653 RepID=UPI002615A8E1|nr:ATP-binding protein [uncultured Microscilla sp.]